MAYADTAVSADELTALGRDYPLFVGSNVLELTSSQLPEWRESGNWTSGSNAAVSGMPGRLAYDRNGKLRTMATGLTTGVLSLVFEILEDATAAFDVAAILGHNFDQVTGLTDIRLQITNTSNFAATEDLAHWAAPFTSARLVSLSLTSASGANRRIANAKYMRLAFYNSGNFSVFPSIAELWLGRRRQLTCYGNLDYPVNPSHSSVVDLVSDSGNTARHTLYRGRGDRTLQFTTGGTTIGTLDTNATFDSLLEDTEDFTKPFLFVEHPSTAPTIAHLMQLESADYVRMARGPAAHDVELPMIELPRFVREED